MPGPQPIPGALKVLRGNPGHKPIPKEVKVPRAFPAPPRDLEPEAKRIWTRIGKAYEEAGVVTTIDVETFAAFCRVAVKVDQSGAALAKAPLVIQTEKGPMRNPLDVVFRDAAQTMRMYARELGLTPASRVGLGRTEEEPGDPLEAWAAK